MARKSVRLMLSRAVAIFAAVPLFAGVAPAPAVATEPLAVRCDYWFVAWTGGFLANLSITNTGPAINGWTARWSFDTPTTNVVGWQARLAVTDGMEVAATNMSYNAVIPTGRTTAFGWTASAPSTSTPTDITVNGVPC